MSKENEWEQAGTKAVDLSTTSPEQNFKWSFVFSNKKTQPALGAVALITPPRTADTVSISRAEENDVF